MSASSASRLGLDIGEYDQVVALSQDNINDVLEYHYDNHQELKKFEAKLATPTKDAIRGTIDAPKIELIDKEGADQAFYRLIFADGIYSWWDQQAADPNAPVDPDAPPASAQWVQKKIPLKGWKLAFYVDFAMKKMESNLVPEKIKEQINLPGSYGVEQLLIDFGTADTMSFNWDRSVVTGFDDKNSEVAARDVISLFVSRWLTKIKSTEGNHNVLGYAVKVDKDQSKNIPKSNPDFPPTAVRLQTINFRPEGKEDKVSPSDGRNAFLFTEMTGHDGPTRLQATKDLPWSGDFFYDSLGGTLVMSRRIFWNKFIKERLHGVNKAAIYALNKVAKGIAPPDLATHASWWLSDTDTVGEGAWSSTEGLNEKYKWQTSKYFDVEHETSGPNTMYEYWTNTTVNHTLRPQVGTGKIFLDYEIEFIATLKLGVWGIPKSVSNFTVVTRCLYSGTLSISLKAVDSTGGLSIEATDSDSKPNITVDADFSGFAMKVVNAIPGVASLFREQGTVDALKKMITTSMESSINGAVATAEGLEAALNGQKRFVLPGGGTFDMKSPIFDNKGDLLIGLSYRKGDVVGKAH
jgi:hypothetical protein